MFGEIRMKISGIFQFFGKKVIKSVLCGFVGGLVKSQVDFSSKGRSGEGTV